MQLTVQHIGHEQQPLLIVDDFVPNPGGLIDFAMQQTNVLPADGQYPGLRSPAPPAYGQFLLEQLVLHLISFFGASAGELGKADCYYSLVSTPANELTLLQRLPHFDRPHPDELAIIHYLCNEQHGGTSFYRHRSTGFESVTAERQSEYQHRLEADLRESALPTGYINGDTSVFERIASIPARFNRALIYRCSSLHSGDIGPDYGYDLNPLSGRFTIASFLSV
ncbi:DUF6445 family protein [Lacimicrobium alkaliphilum]|uniref:Uncharacterized protein n=1 Tax=Lacimicrobium alkaliphilum TaxID=1526571 RepID=A0A0U2ZNQ5_9ALTE|nr:DUF6445 family protein [Lacimicrobium alkaliphilum]ALS99900.1 hypothetical protein AT746_17595 [Lacimicrobium alkaliphilum]